MQFFLPQSKPGQTELAYQEIVDTLKRQFRLPIEDRRIRSIRYFNSKKNWHAEVGYLEQQEHRYEIVAILESKWFIVCTRSKTGAPGPTILVDKGEVTEVEDFASKEGIKHAER